MPWRLSSDQIADFSTRTTMNVRRERRSADRTHVAPDDRVDRCAQT
jgi:hypothetical protein